MSNTKTLRGFATISYWADDVLAAKKWYTKFLDIEPYFERSGPDGQLVYIEFRLGDFQHELGIIDRRYEPLMARGDSGFVTASVVDPFGNILGIMYNPHYLEILEIQKN
ncbi:hypothetical protein SAMN05444392_104188 [Seinonella peptonophila]|uniref:VOC domain-containing protein n=1 Tax=Seinonella peptonophila TaxID=112248 RepID=A0A1M4X8E3_9BACL|nr:VOC family protein [Seinonella peptonophila]SHE89665.1 hypothetical protein SAMN05444392_104188 [Seinonella peptonophila]